MNLSGAAERAAVFAGRLCQPGSACAKPLALRSMPRRGDLGGLAGRNRYSARRAASQRDAPTMGNRRPMASSPYCSRRSVLLLPLAAMASARPSVETVAGYAGPRLPYPQRILVYPLAVSPEEVQLDQGIVARLQRETSDVPLQQRELAAAQTAGAAITQTVVKELRGYGLPAEYAYGPTLPRSGSTLLVKGQLVALNEGRPDAPHPHRSRRRAQQRQRRCPGAVQR